MIEILFIVVMYVLRYNNMPVSGSWNEPGVDYSVLVFYFGRSTSYQEFNGGI